MPADRRAPIARPHRIAGHAFQTPDPLPLHDERRRHTAVRVTRLARAPALTPRVAIGWREWVALPALGIDALRAKVDTGARSSALHVDTQWCFNEAGAPWVGFRLTTDVVGRVVEGRAPVHDMRPVTDSGGHRTERVFIATDIALGGVTRRVEVNLADRRGMRFPMLLGRTALARAFVVHPGRAFVLGRPAAP